MTNLPFDPGSIQSYEARAEDALRESLFEYLDDESMIHRLPSIIKSAVQEAYKESRDKADRIKSVYSTMFKEEEI